MTVFYLLLLSGVGFDGELGAGVGAPYRENQEQKARGEAPGTEGAGFHGFAVEATALARGRASPGVPSGYAEVRG